MVNKSIRSETHKTAVVTGGSRGLGRNTSLNLATRGVDIIFTYHSNQAEADSLISEVEGIGQKAAAFRLDTAELRGFDAFVAEVRNTLRSWARERFDYLVNNAAIIERSTSRMLPRRTSMRWSTFTSKASSS